VKIVILEIDDPLPVRGEHRGVVNVPLEWHFPVICGAPGRHLVDDERQLLSDDGQGASHTLPRDAAADGIQLGGKLEQLLSNPC